MKKLHLVFCTAAALNTTAQITINSNHLPNAGDLLFTRAATLLTDIDCADLGSLSLVDQLFFNNPLYPEYNSDFGIGAALLDNPVISIEDAYQIYKNSGGVYAMTGIVATVAGVPLNAQYDDRDIIYDLPLTYPSSGNSHSVLELDVPTLAYYGTDQYRNYVCDGWGTLTLYGQSFDVLRVKSTLIGFDSVSVNFNDLPFGFQIPKDIHSSHSRFGCWHPRVFFRYDESFSQSNCLRTLNKRRYFIRLLHHHECRGSKGERRNSRKQSH